jgi:hypothetical protein
VVLKACSTDCTREGIPVFIIIIVMKMYLISLYTVKCYHSVQNLLCSSCSCSFLSKNLRIKIYRTIILPVLLYGCETWSLILREEHRLMVFANRVLKRIFRPKRDEVTGL